MEKFVLLPPPQAVSRQAGGYAWKGSLTAGFDDSLSSLPLRIRDVYSLSRGEFDDYGASVLVQPYRLIEYPALEDHHRAEATSPNKKRLVLDRRARIGIQYYYWMFDNVDYQGYDMNKLDAEIGYNSERLAELEIGSNQVIRSVYLIYEP